MVAEKSLFQKKERISLTPLPVTGYKYVSGWTRRAYTLSIVQIYCWLVRGSWAKVWEWWSTPGSGGSGRYFSLYLGLLPLVSLSSRPADEGEGVLLVAAGAAGGGGEGGHHQTLRDLRGLWDFPPVFPHMSSSRLSRCQQVSQHKVSPARKYDGVEFRWSLETD